MQNASHLSFERTARHVAQAMAFIARTAHVDHDAAPLVSRPRHDQGAHGCPEHWGTAHVQARDWSDRPSACRRRGRGPRRGRLRGEGATRAGDLPKRSSRRGFFRLCERAMALRMPVAGAGEAGFHSWAADGLSGAILALSDCTTPSVRCNGKARNGRKLVDWSADRAWDTARLRHRDGSDGVPRPMRENSGRLLQLSYAAPWPDRSVRGLLRTGTSQAQRDCVTTQRYHRPLRIDLSEPPSDVTPRDPRRAGNPRRGSCFDERKSLAGNRRLHDLPHSPHRHAQKNDKESEAAEKPRGAIPPIPEHSSGLSLDAPKRPQE